MWRRCVTDRTCQKWSVKFHAGDLSLDDTSRSGRTVEVDSNQMETAIENNQCYTTWERADICKISKTMKLLVKMKNVCLLFYGKHHTDFWASLVFCTLWRREMPEGQLLTPGGRVLCIGLCGCWGCSASQVTKCAGEPCITPTVIKTWHGLGEGVEGWKRLAKEHECLVRGPWTQPTMWWRPGEGNGWKGEREEEWRSSVIVTTIKKEKLNK